MKRPEAQEFEQIETTVGALPAYLELADNTGIALNIIGPHGVGKTQIVYQWAEESGRLVCDRVVSIMDPTADFAMAGLDAEGDLKFRHNRSFPFKGFEAEWVHPKSKNAPLIFFDEFNQAQTSQQNMAMKLVLERHLHNRPLIEGSMMVLAGNRLSDHAFVNRSSGPMANRVLWLYLQPSLEDFFDYAHSTGRINEFVVAYLKLNPEHLHISTMQETTLDDQTKTMISYEGPHPTPRTWEFVSKVLDSEPTEHVRLTAVAGLVGPAVATQFEQTYRLKDDMPNLTELCKTGKGKVPKDVGTRFVLVSALLKRVDANNLGNILTYFGNMDPEVSVMFVKLMLKHKLTLASHPAYAAWAVKHGNLLA
ncbi:MAG: ATP-binding protein [bacterium]|nr:ATP-binding protein [bacterium]